MVIDRRTVPIVATLASKLHGSRNVFDDNKN